MNAFLGVLATVIGYPLLAIYKVINNYGLAVIILTILVRAIMLPLYAKQIKYSAKMADVQPKIKAIQTKYANDMQTQNEKLQELYKEEDISPSAGCLPLLIQMPIIMGLYQLLRNPLLYLSGYSFMIAAVHEDFIWISDLSQPDAWILPILAGITTYFTYAATSNSAPDATGMMNSMKFIFPVMIFMMGKSFPAALALYWTVGNVFTVGQTLLLNKKYKGEKFKKDAIEEAKKNIKKEAAN